MPVDGALRRQAILFGWALLAAGLVAALWPLHGYALAGNALWPHRVAPDALARSAPHPPVPPDIVLLSRRLIAATLAGVGAVIIVTVARSRVPICSNPRATINGAVGLLIAALTVGFLPVAGGGDITGSTLHRSTTGRWSAGGTTRS